MPANHRHLTTIKANRPWWDLEVREFLKYKDLLYLIVRRDFVTTYKQTILGPLWVIIQALMGSAVFTVVFSGLAGLSTDGHPAFLFYLTGTLAWQYFATVFGAGSNALQAHLPLFAKVYFPRLIPPLCDSLSALFKWAIQLAVFFLALFIYNQNASPDAQVLPRPEALILLPALLLQSALLSLGIGFLVSAASVKYRDLAQIAGMSTQFIMYATPVIYPISEVPETYRPYLAYNPLTFIVETYRHLLLGHATAATPEYAIPSVVATLLLFLIGLVVYNKTQRTYVDYV